MNSRSLNMQNNGEKKSIIKKPLKQKKTKNNKKNGIIDEGIGKQMMNE